MSRTRMEMRSRHLVRLIVEELHRMALFLRDCIWALPHIEKCQSAPNRPYRKIAVLHETLILTGSEQKELFIFLGLAMGDL